MKKGMLFAGAVLLLSAITFAAGKDPLAQYLVDSGKTYPAKGNFKQAEPWKAGQYVVTAQSRKGKVESVSKTLVVGKEGTGWIIEVTSIDEKGRESVSQMLFEGMDEALKTGNAGGVKLGWMKMRDEDGKTQKIEGQAIMMFNALAKSTWEGLVVNVATFTDGGAQKVKAGTFNGTAYQKASVKVMGMKIDTETWYHPSVPVNGLVKSTDGKTTTELLSFGYDGKPVLQ